MQQDFDRNCLGRLRNIVKVFQLYLATLLMSTAFIAETALAQSANDRRAAEIRANQNKKSKNRFDIVEYSKVQAELAKFEGLCQTAIERSELEVAYKYCEHATKFRAINGRANFVYGMLLYRTKDDRPSLIKAKHHLELFTGRSNRGSMLSPENGYEFKDALIVLADLARRGLSEGSDPEYDVARYLRQCAFAGCEKEFFSHIVNMYDLFPKFFPETPLFQANWRRRSVPEDSVVCDQVRCTSYSECPNYVNRCAAILDQPYWINVIFWKTTGGEVRIAGCIAHPKSEEYKKYVRYNKAVCDSVGYNYDLIPAINDKNAAMVSFVTIEDVVRIREWYR